MFVVFFAIYLPHLWIGSQGTTLNKDPQIKNKIKTHHPGPVWLAKEADMVLPGLDCAHTAAALLHSPAGGLSAGGIIRHLNARNEI